MYKRLIEEAYVRMLIGEITKENYESQKKSLLEMEESGEDPYI